MQRIQLLSLTLAVGLAALSSSGVARAQNCEFPGALVVLDRSTSMRGTIGGVSKWNIATDALSMMVTNFEDSVHFGLMVYPGPAGDGARGIEGDVPACFGGVDCTPDGPQCTTGEVVVDIGADHADPVIDALVFPDSVHDSYTPTWQSLEAAAGYAPLRNHLRRNFVVLITDGWQCCGVYSDADGVHCTNAGSERYIAVDRVADLRELGITTYVIGFGGSVDAEALNRMANAAGTALPGCNPDAGVPCYYQADNHGQLEGFLSEIGRRISDEICDGRDNDCDDEVDEDLWRPCETACGEGRASCIGPDTWSECDAPAAEAERCDGEDNDCDGDTDEGNPGGGGSCGTSVGECEAGSLVCRDGDLVCEGQRGPSEEVCDGRDNDCNGAADDEIDCDCRDGQERPCGTDNGECVAGTQVCSNGSWGACEGAVEGTPETCDGLDNDCDLLVDEDPTGAPLVQDCSTLCGEGTETCLNGNWVGCNAPQPAVDEFCNGLDDDCDGETDEALSRPCNNGCEGLDGVEVCAEGDWSDCNAPEPADDELCGDDVDNDCDGSTDEGCEGCVEGETRACGTNEGECEEGLSTCEDGVWSVCRGGQQRQAEQCDGLDNDCDGEVDEASDEACSNDCGDGVRECVNGELGECWVPDPPAEVCDGLDNDCDGEQDEGDLCDGGERCFCGDCMGPCDQGECPGGAECIGGYCIVDRCPEGYHCEETPWGPGVAPGGVGVGHGAGHGDGGGEGDDAGLAGGAPVTDGCDCRLQGSQAGGRAGLLLLLVLGGLVAARRR